ncbi:Rhodanese-like domain-containing protein [Gaertneriomyces semiglobifer]|nr:Rhodanese-like domain-containing protein [Gaertneriomyces semiglobifer]
MRRTQSCSAVGSDKDTTFNLTTDPELDSALLPWFPGRSDSHKRISGETLGHLLDGHFDDKVDEYYILDCRFPYEFNGGHIATARNINTKSELIDLFFKPPRSEKNVVVVFHCEFSSHRAPRMASFMRKYDRQLNIETYPNLHYPEIYVLEGGYRRFYSEFKARCTPQKYVEMVDPAFIHDLKTSKAAHRREFGRSASQSYVGGNC